MVSRSSGEAPMQGSLRQSSPERRHRGLVAELAGGSADDDRRTLERLHERVELELFVRRETERLPDAGIVVRIEPAPRIEVIDDGTQRESGAVVKVWRGHHDLAERRREEFAAVLRVPRDARAPFVGSLPVEARRRRAHVVEGTIGEVRSDVAARAAALADEERHALLRRLGNLPATRVPTIEGARARGELAREDGERMARQIEHGLVGDGRDVLAEGAAEPRHVAGMASEDPRELRRRGRTRGPELLVV